MAAKNMIVLKSWNVHHYDSPLPWWCMFCANPYSLVHCIALFYILVVYKRGILLTCLLFVSFLFGGEDTLLVSTPHTHTHARTHAHTHACKQARAHKHAWRAHTRTHACMHTHTYTQTQTNTHILYIHTHTYTQTHTHTHIYVYMHVDI